MQLSGFDANAVEPQEAFEPLAAGWYKAVITESEEKPTKAQTGSYLQIKLQVIEGNAQGRVIFDRLNLNNPNGTAVDIAQRTLSAICRAVGIMTPRDSTELHDKPMMVKIVVKPASGDYSAGNEVKGYEPVNGASQAPAGASAGAATPPWKR
jgi:hypothetical protein